MAFKSCTCCRQNWESRVDFLLSSNITLSGYQPAFDSPQNGLLLFNHLATGCHTTLAVRVAEFYDMYKGPHYPKVQKGLAQCSGKCLNSEDFTKCNAECAMAYIREIMQIIMHLKSGKITINSR